MSQKNNKHAGERLILTAGEWRLDLSRTGLQAAALATLGERLRAAGLAERVAALFSGACVNPSENQPARHMLLRAQRPDAEIAGQREHFLKVAEGLNRAEPILDLLHIGIGGSDLGPRLVTEALGDGAGGLRVHWLSTLDGRRFERLTRQLDPHHHIDKRSTQETHQGAGRSMHTGRIGKQIDHQSH